MKNTGFSGRFLVSQHSRHGVVGRLVTESVFLQNGQFVTLKVDDIIIPEHENNSPELVLKVEKNDFTGYDTNNVQSMYDNEGGKLNIASQVRKRRSAVRPDYAPPGYRTSVSSTVIFNIVAGPQVQEKDHPLANMWKTENACPYVDQCTDAHWKVEFSAKDLGSGMFSIKMSSLDEHHKIFWWHEPFKVGGKSQVEGGAWVSCCSQRVGLEVEDVAMNRVVVSAVEDDGTQWEIIVPVIIGGAAFIVVLIVIIGVCMCRRKYSQVSQTYV